MCATTGATRNAATPRSNSTSANTRCSRVDSNEKPAMNNAGETEAPTPRPTRPDPIRTSASEPLVTPLSTAAPALSTTIPVIASTGM
jgi:hypothetical protein